MLCILRRHLFVQLIFGSYTRTHPVEWNGRLKYRFEFYSIQCIDIFMRPNKPIIRIDVFNSQFTLPNFSFVQIKQNCLFAWNGCEFGFEFILFFCLHSHNIVRMEQFRFRYISKIENRAHQTLIVWAKGQTEYICVFPILVQVTKSLQ